MPEHETLPPLASGRIPHVGTYRRVLPVSLERMYENALDWEHLPYVHASSFAAIRCLDAGQWGWRAELTGAGGEASIIELLLDRRCHRWITRNLEGPNAGAEIWTHVFALAPVAGAERIEIVVDFFVPDVPEAGRARVGQAYALLYATLYDEDVAMMVERQAQLDRRVEGSRPDERRLALGPREVLDLPLRCTVAGRDYVVAEDTGSLVAYPAICPHALGPLARGALGQGVVTCPWHGYRFDVRSGECLSGHSCRLSRLPVISEESGTVVLTIPD
jgi:nitrite reductase/ring-hydroxylating ferredoxin subunit